VDEIEELDGEPALVRSQAAHQVPLHARGLQEGDLLSSRLHPVFAEGRDVDDVVAGVAQGRCEHVGLPAFTGERERERERERRLDLEQNRLLLVAHLRTTFSGPDSTDQVSQFWNWKDGLVCLHIYDSTSIFLSLVES